MPIAPKPEGPVIGNVSSEYLKSNFIIHSASLVEGGGPGVLGMNFCVSFLNKNAEPCETVWLSGSAMLSISTHTQRKCKYVYDETLYHKDGWTTRNDSHQHYVGSDDDEVPLSSLKAV